MRIMVQKQYNPVYIDIPKAYNETDTICLSWRVGGVEPRRAPSCCEGNQLQKHATMKRSNNKILLLLVLCFVKTTTASSKSSLWIDPETPVHAQTTTGMDNRKLDLVFSDEFNNDGRIFHDGSDTRWTAEDRPATTNAALHYYNSSKVTTRSGNLVIETAAEDASWIEHDMNGTEHPFTRNYTSGMVTTWNKFCFTGGLVEISFQLPGRPHQGGLWPAFWQLGNLARPSYLETTDSIWPWSYDECGLSPDAQDALQGQAMNACNNPRGRGSPEIDIIEAQPGDHILEYENVPHVDGSHFDLTLGRPLMSSSLQVAPGVNSLRRPTVPDFPNTGEWYPDLFPMGGPAYGDSKNKRMINNYWYGQPITNDTQVWQDGLSINWQHSERFYERQTVLRMEWQVGEDDGYVRWFDDDNDLLFEVTAAMLKSKPGSPDAIALIPYEAMYLILNTDVSPKWGWNGCDPSDPCSLAHPGLCSSDGTLLCTDCRNPDCLVCPDQTEWLSEFCNDISPSNPAEYKIDYIRVYQDTSDSSHTLGCDPPDLPTKDYINENWEKYTFDPFVNKQPLSIVHHGGGFCASASDCGLPLGLVGGLCKDGKCECLSNWTGPNCQSPCIGEYANCDGTAPIPTNETTVVSESEEFSITKLGVLLGFAGALVIVLFSCLIGFCYCCRNSESGSTSDAESTLASFQMAKRRVEPQRDSRRQRQTKKQNQPHQGSRQRQMERRHERHDSWRWQYSV